MIRKISLLLIIVLFTFGSCSKEPSLPVLPNTIWSVSEWEAPGYIRFGEGGSALMHVGIEDKIIKYNYEYDYPNLKLYPEEERYSNIKGTFNGQELSLFNESKSKVIGVFVEKESSPSLYKTDSQQVRDFLVMLSKISTYEVVNSLMQFAQPIFVISKLSIKEYDDSFSIVQEYEFENLKYGEGTGTITANDNSIMIYCYLEYYVEDVPGGYVIVGGKTGSGELLSDLKLGGHTPINIQFQFT